MSVRGRPEQRDANEAKIVEALRAHGWMVECISSADFPDLLCVRGRVIQPGEVKSDTDGRMRAGQVDLHARWEAAGHPIPVFTTPEEAVRVMSLIAQGAVGKHLTMRTYRDFPWKGVTAEEKARRLAVSEATRRP